MIVFNPQELDGLIETLSHQPGRITAVVVPAGSGDALLEQLRERLGELEIEIAPRSESPFILGRRAAELGYSGQDWLFVLRFDEPGHFESHTKALEYWHSLNYQREALASGTVRTCLLLNEETALGLARGADDLWDWTTVFRFPEAIETSVRSPVDTDQLIWDQLEKQLPASESDLALLRSQWQRAQRAGLPQPDVVLNYAVPFFLALPTANAAEALEIWKQCLVSKAASELSPETRLLVARKLMVLAGLKELEGQRDALVSDAIEAAEAAVATLESKTTNRPEAFEPAFAAALSAASKLHQDAGRFALALNEIEKCLEILTRVAESEEKPAELLVTYDKRRWALKFLIQAQHDHELPLLEQVESLRATEGPSLDKGLRSDALGAALEIAISQLYEQTPGGYGALLAAWLLSDEAQLEGPQCEDLLAYDPVSYCKALEAVWLLTAYTPWQQLLIEPLAQTWAMNGAGCSGIREQLVGWLLHFLGAESGSKDRETEEQLGGWGRLHWVAIKVFGYRYEPELLHVFCRCISSLCSRDDVQRSLWYSTTSYLGFMLRWSFQEPSLEPLAGTAADPESSAAAQAAAWLLAHELRQTELPEILRPIPGTAPFAALTSLLARSSGGQTWMLPARPAEELADLVLEWGFAWLADDPRVPPLRGRAYETWAAQLGSRAQTASQTWSLWQAGVDASPEHHVRRLQTLRSCRSDKEIALHALVAHMSGMLPELELIGKELLANERQLERLLGVSLLAWHPNGDRWLEPLTETDPSTWVREHAHWAIAVCRQERDRQAGLDELKPRFSEQLDWRGVIGRDLEKYCRGEDISRHLDLGEKGVPWLVA
ncbi:MAG: hypothetical protein HC897_10175 [Thermoanaerobaculia bacterium]|nr:hypothetical protein [Thermoanaerobaculia bacterium]